MHPIVTVIVRPPRRKVYYVVVEVGSEKGKKEGLNWGSGLGLMQVNWSVPRTYMILHSTMHLSGLTFAALVSC